MKETEENNEIISLKEASKISGYNQDYLGELCRGGKLEAKKIGRNWTTTRVALAKLMGESESENEVIQTTPATEVSQDQTELTSYFAVEEEIIPEIETETEAEVAPVVEPILDANILSGSTPVMASNFDFGTTSNISENVFEEKEIVGISSDQIKKLENSFHSKKKNSFAMVIGLAAFALTTVLLGVMFLTDSMQQELSTKIFDGYYFASKTQKANSEKQNQATSNSITALSHGNEVVGSEKSQGQVLAFTTHDPNGTLIPTVQTFPLNEEYVRRYIDGQFNILVGNGLLKGPKGDKGDTGTPGSAGSNGASGGITYQPVFTAPPAFPNQSPQSMISATSVTAENLTATKDLTVLGTANIENLNVTGNISGNFLTNLTQGSVAFQGVSGLAEDNANFFFNDTSNSLGIGTNTINASALLELSSTSKGFLAPRMTTAQRNLIATPAEGLLVYNTSTGQFNVYSGGVWTTISGGGGGGALSDITAATTNATINNLSNNVVWNWELNGAESGFTFGENVASTGGSNNQEVVRINTLATSTATPIKIVNLGAGRSFQVDDETTDSTPFVIDTDGNVGIGTTSPDAQLELAGGRTQAAWGLNGTGLQGASATFIDSSTAISGTATNAVINSFGQPTLAATNATVTTTNAANVYIANAPTAGTNQTITNAYALWVDNGTTRLDGTLQTNVTGSTQCLQASTTGVVSGTSVPCGTATTTLQQAYDNDANGGNSTITLSNVDDYLAVVNPSSNGTTTGFTLFVDQQSTGATHGLYVGNAGGSNALIVDTSSSNGNGASFDIGASNNGQYALRVTSGNGSINGLNVSGDGTVGIGTTTALNKLFVEIASAGDGFGVTGSGTNAPQFSLYEGATQKGAMGLALSAANYSAIAAAQDVVVRSLQSSANGSLIMTVQNATGDFKISTGSNTSNDSLKMIVTNAGNVGIGTATPDGKLEIAGNLTQAAWGLNGIQLQATTATYTDSSTAGAGTATNAVFNSFGQPTLAATNATVTTTNAANVYIANAPTAGTNQTITNAYALWVDAGATRLDGTLQTNVTGSTQCLQASTTGVVSGTSTPCGTSTTTLQQAYDNDADSANALITTNATDGDLVVQTIAGTSFQIQQITSAPSEDMVQITNAGLGNVTDGIDGMQITWQLGDDADATELTAALRISASSSSNDQDNLVGVLVDDLITPTAALEYGLSVRAGWDRALNILGTTSQTTQNAINISGYSYNHTGAETGSLNTISFTDASSNATGSAVTNGILISPTINTTASAGSKTINGVALAPTYTACGTTAGTCIYNGFTQTLPAVTQSTTNNLTINGSSITSAGAIVQNTAAGTINWNGANIQMPNQTQTTGTVTSVGLKVTGGTVTSGTAYALTTSLSAGNVGIGITAPTAQVDVFGNGDSAGSSLLLRGGNSIGNNDWAQIAFGFDGTSDYRHSIRTRHNGNALTDNAIDFYLWDQGTDAQATLGTNHVMTLQDNGGGSVGIQTTNPSFPLSFGASTGNKIALYDAGSGTGYGFGIQSNQLQIFAQNQTDRTSIGWGNSASYNETLSVKDTYVGIGTINPDARLELAGNRTQNAWGLNGIVIQDTASIFTDASTSSSTTATNAAINSFGQATINATNTTVTTTNAYGMYLAGAPISGTNQTLTNTYGLRIAATATTDGAGGTPTNSFGLFVDPQTGATNNYAAVFSGGNVGIGTTAPTQSLDVNGNALIEGTNSLYLGGITNTSVNGVRHFYNTSAGGALIDTRVDAATKGIVYRIDTSSGGTERMRLTANGQLGIGTSTPDARLEVAGGQSQAAWGLNGIQLQASDASFADTSSSGTVTNVVINSFNTPTITASNASTYTNAANLYIAASPVAGSNATITNGYALWSDSGLNRFDGSVGVKVVSPQTDLEVGGAIRLSTTGVDTYTSPLGASISTKINVPNFNPGAFGQILAMGLPSSADSNARVITMLDQRTAGHQPSLNLLSPDENQIFGLTWDGSNTIAQINSSKETRINSSDATSLTNNGTVGVYVTRVGSSPRVIIGGSNNSTTLLYLQGNSISGSPTVDGAALRVDGASFQDTATATSGTAQAFANSSFNSPTISASNTGVTTTNAINVYIPGTVNAGSNQTITNSYGLYIDENAPSGTVTNSYGILASAASAGATNRYAASFIGGNVGIGTMAPVAPLHVSSAVGAYTVPTMILQSTNPTNGQTYMKYITTGVGSDWSTGVAGNEGGQFVIGTGDIADNPWIAIHATGEVGINQLDPQAQLDVNGTVRFEDVNNCASGIVSDADGDLSCLTSSKDFKENIKDLSFNGLELVQRLKPVSFTYKGKTQTEYGFIAEDVAEVDKTLTFANNEGKTYGVKYHEVAPILVKAIQDQAKSIDKLQKQIASLQGDLNTNLSAAIDLTTKPLYLSSDSVGQAEIKKGSKSVKVIFSKPYEHPPIVTATVIGIHKTFYGIEGIDANGFSISIESPSEEDIKFNWHSFSGPEAKIYVSDGSTKALTLTPLQTEAPKNEKEPSKPVTPKPPVKEKVESPKVDKKEITQKPSDSTADTKKVEEKIKEEVKKELSKTIDVKENSQKK